MCVPHCSARTVACVRHLKGVNHGLKKEIVLAMDVMRTQQDTLVTRYFPNPPSHTHTHTHMLSFSLAVLYSL